MTHPAAGNRMAGMLTNRAVKAPKIESRRCQPFSSWSARVVGTRSVVKTAARRQPAASWCMHLRKITRRSRTRRFEGRPREVDVRPITAYIPGEATIAGALMVLGARRPG